MGFAKITGHIDHASPGRYYRIGVEEARHGYSGRILTVDLTTGQHLNRLVDQDPLQHGSLSSQWSCRELATVLVRQTGCESVPDPAELTFAYLELAALEHRARRNEIIF